MVRDARHQDASQSTGGLRRCALGVVLLPHVCRGAHSRVASSHTAIARSDYRSRACAVFSRVPIRNSEPHAPRGAGPYVRRKTVASVLATACCSAATAEGCESNRFSGATYGPAPPSGVCGSGDGCPQITGCGRCMRISIVRGCRRRSSVRQNRQRYDAFRKIPRVVVKYDPMPVVHVPLAYPRCSISDP